MTKSMASDKIYTQKVNRLFFEQNVGLFLNGTWQKVKLELIPNITHQMTSMRESFIPQKRATEAFQCPGYVIRLQKKRHLQAKTKNLNKNYARKRCPPNQLKIKIITKSNQNLRLHFLRVNKFVKQMTPIFVIL